MHEIKLVKKLISVLEKEAASPEVGAIKTVYLEVGRLHYDEHPNEVIENCFKNLPKSTKLRKAKINIRILPAKIKCFDCGKESIIRQSQFCCKGCLGNNVKIVSGDEFNLKRIEW